MVGIGKEFFVQLPGKKGRRMLLPATVVGVGGDVITTKPEDADSSLKDDIDVLIYFNQRRDFLKQAAHLSEVQDDPEMLFVFETAGDTMSAESRECFRVSTVATDATARLGEEDACQILDISATGFAARPFGVRALLVVSAERR